MGRREEQAGAVLWLQQGPWECFDCSPHHPAEGDGDPAPLGLLCFYSYASLKAALGPYPRKSTATGSRGLPLTLEQPSHQFYLQTW